MTQVDELISQLNALHLKESKILKRLEEARTQEATTKSKGLQGSVRRSLKFRVGDRVALKTVRFPHTGPNDRRAIVTVVSRDKVHIRTLNGRETWRAPKNLTLLE
jgi:hypothetical protein